MNMETPSKVMEKKKIPDASVIVNRDDKGWQMELSKYPDYLQEISYSGYDIGYKIFFGEGDEGNWIVAQSESFEGETETLNRVVNQFSEVINFFISHGGNYDIEVLRLSMSSGNVVYLGASLSALYLTPKALKDTVDNPSLFEAGLLHELIHLKREHDERAAPEDDITAYWASFVYLILKGVSPIDFDKAKLKTAREELLPRVKKEICEVLSLDKDIEFNKLVKTALENNDKLEVALKERITALFEEK